MKNRSYLNDLYAVFFIGFFLVGQVTTTADDLSKSFFPTDSPLFANFYPNDFLPWGVFLFMSVGWLLPNYLIRNIKEKSVNFALFFCIFLIIVAFWGLESWLKFTYQENFSQGHWSYLLSQLLEIWELAWMIGLGWAYYVYQITKKTGNVES